MHRREIERLIGKTTEKGLTLVPTRVYFKGRAKVELALARGKDVGDKRRALKERDRSARSSGRSASATSPSIVLEHRVGCARSSAPQRAEIYNGMTLILIFALIAVLVTVFCLVLGLAAARRADTGPDPLEWLMDLRSPSGSRFFPNKESAREFVDDLDEISDRDRGRPPIG